MSRELYAELDGQGLTIGIIVSRFNKDVTSKLLEGAKAALIDHGTRDEDITIAWVPGSFETPLVAKKMSESDRYNAVICLGAVIKGETDHYKHVSDQVARGIASVSLSTGIPVIFGVLTTETIEQAVARAGGHQGNNGYTAGVAAIEMANLNRALNADCSGRYSDAT